jgi:hypothetical protein
MHVLLTSVSQRNHISKVRDLKLYFGHCPVAHLPITPHIQHDRCASPDAQLPKRRRNNKNGTVTNLSACSQHIEPNTAIDTCKKLRAFLPQMDARDRHNLRGAALANSHTNDIPVPRTTRVPQSQWLPPWSQSESVLRCLHDNATGTNCSSARILDHLRHFALVECDVLSSGL